MLFYKNSNFSRTLIFIAILICGLYVGQVASGSTELKSIVSGYGYLGLFIVSVVAGFNLAVPMPAVALMPLFMESGLSFSISILIMTAGMTVADIVAFALARLGRKLATKSFGNEFFRKIDFFRDKYEKFPMIVLFLFASFVPLPNELLVVPLALLGYSFYRIILAVFLGNALFNILFSQGYLNIFYLLG